MEHFRFIFFSSKCFIKFILVMSKKTVKVIFEVLKAIVYALSGFFGGNALM